jgi:hypothetical protein
MDTPNEVAWIVKELKCFGEFRARDPLRSSCGKVPACGTMQLNVASMLDDFSGNMVKVCKCFVVLCLECVFVCLMSDENWRRTSGYCLLYPSRACPPDEAIEKHEEGHELGSLCPYCRRMGKSPPDLF